MKRTIGLDRELKLRWMDMGAGLAQTERDKLALRARLMDTLAADIPAHFVRVKTCTVLIRTWWTVPAEQADLRERAFDLLKTDAPDQRIVIHWGMLLLAYPFFREVVSAIGRAAAVQETISRDQVTRRVIETWGERTTVKRSILRVFQTCAEWGVLIPNSAEETYRAAQPLSIADAQLTLWLAEVTLRARATAIPLSVLVQTPEDFPFRLALTVADITRSGKFETFREGPELLVGVRCS
jgi:hypothetical protein